jgi:hypothetical protein
MPSGKSVHSGAVSVGTVSTTLRVTVTGMLSGDSVSLQATRKKIINKNIDTVEI